MAGTHDIARAAGTQDTVVKAVFGAITEAVRNGERVLIKDFGSFEKRHVNARVVKSPQIPNGEAEVPEHDVLKFRASPATKQMLNGTPEAKPAAKPAPAKAAAPKPANGAAKPANGAAKPAAAKPVPPKAAPKPAPKKAAPQPEVEAESDDESAEA